MKAHIKQDFEQHLIDLCVADGKKVYLDVSGTRVYLWFEGQTITESDTYINLKIVPIEVSRKATNVKYHTGYYRFYVYGLSTIHCDKIVDHLSSILDEKIITGASGARIETGILSTFQRGNRFGGSSRFETIANLDFHHWESAV